MMLLVFLAGFSLLEGIGIVSACPKILNNFKTDVFEVDLLIIITSVPFPTHQVLAFASTSSVLHGLSTTRPGSPRLALASEFWAPCNWPSQLFASSTRLAINR